MYFHPGDRVCVNKDIYRILNGAENLYARIGEMGTVQRVFHTHQSGARSAVAVQVVTQFGIKTFRPTSLQIIK